jgi:hypothetical protein
MKFEEKKVARLGFRRREERSRDREQSLSLSTFGSSMNLAARV